MRDILADVKKWIAHDEPIALATVIHTWGSSPRRTGAKMAFTPDGKISGSVSGGCVEGAVVEAGVATLKNGRPQLLKFGVADENAWEVGLACGGQIEVFVKPLDRTFFDRLQAELGEKQTFAVASVVSGPPDLLGKETLIDGNQSSNSIALGLDEIVMAKARRALADGNSSRFDLEWKQASLQIFVEVVKPPPTLVIVGGVHIAIALAGIAKTLGFETLVVDPRRAFGTAERFPDVDQLVQAWPEDAFSQIVFTDQTAVAMLTHDPKIDDPALKIALNSPAFYVGALGSQKTQEKRRKRLLASGLSERQLARLHGPIGLAIGGETPEEIALAIMAEIVATRHAI
jgi:xanthine dehydrogenase accessory factor